LTWFSCSRKEASLLDAVPLNAEIVMESADSTVIMRFDSLLGSNIHAENVVNGIPMAIVKMPCGDQSDFLLLTQPNKKDIKVLGYDYKGVEAVNNQLKNPEKIYSDTDFARLQKTLGHNVKAHLYYRHPNGWALLDVLPEGNTLVMNGYAMAADSTSAWRPLKYQLPVKNSVVNILPSDTRYMHHLGMSDYASYWQSFRDSEKVAAFNKKYNTDVENKLLAFLSEVSFNKFGKTQREVFVGRMNDPSAVIKFMERLASKTGVASSQTCQGYTLYDLGKSSFIPDVFGEDFISMKRCCYAIVDQYLVMAPNMETIQEVIAGYRSGRTLDLNEGFRMFQQKMLESANVTFFEVKSDSKEAVQLASSKDLVYTNVCISWETEVKSENNIRWKANLDAPLQGKPYIVEDKGSSNNNVVAFDRQNMMYLIDSNGAILWKKQLDEAPMSEVFTVDCHNDGRLQFLFNTAHTIQLIDRDGHNFAGYPIRLPFEASNGLSVFDYNDNRDYRILLCGTDRLVYNFTIQGEEVEGWNRHRAEDQVRQPVRHIVADTKDYLIVSDVSGGVRILDRQGRIRIPLSTDMQKSPQADIYTNATNSRKGLFLTSDKEGKLLYVAADGALNRTDFGTYSEKHFFLYEDFNGDQDPDFIYLDGNELHVFDRFKTELFNHHFDVEITTKPVFFRISRNKRLLGVVSEKAREITLIDRKGKMIVNSGLVGETPFAVGSLHNDQEINLITGVGNALFNYAIY
jgi:hypothetical protein